jgi:type IV secretion system protein VirD4
MLVSGVSMALRLMYSDAHLPQVHKFISGPDLFDFCRQVQSDPPGDFIVERISRIAAKGAEDNRETASIISAAITGLSFMGNIPISRSMSDSTINFRDMRKRPMTCYLVLPGDRSITCAKWFATIVNAWGNANMRDARQDVPLLGILDEFKTSVGNLAIIETMMGMAAGYGVQLLPIVRNLPELQELMPKGWETFLSNTGFKLVFPPGELTTSEYFSKLSGTSEVYSMSKAAREQPWTPLQIPNGMIDAINQKLRPGAGGEPINIAPTGKPAYRPEDIRELGGDEMLVFGENIKGVIRAGRKPYYMDPEFAGRFDPDPFHKKKTARVAAGQG